MIINKKHIGYTNNLLEFRGKTTNNNYSAITTEWFKTITVIFDKNPENKLNFYKNSLNKKTELFFNSKNIILIINNKKTIITFDPAITIIKNKHQFNNIYHISPHSDDLCPSSPFLSREKDQVGNIYSQIIIGDYFGVSIPHGMLLIAELLEKKQQKHNHINNSIVNNILHDSRLEEHRQACLFMNINYLQSNIKNDCYTAKKIIIDEKQQIHSYLSEYKDLDSSGYKNLFNQFKNNIKSKFDKKNRLTLIIPYIFDYHPIHQKISELFISFYLNLPKNIAKNIDIWMQPTGDILNQFRTNIYYPYQDFKLPYEVWNIFETQTIRNPNYPFYNRTIDIINALQINSGYRYATKFLKIKII